MAILLVDAGNSRLKYAHLAGGRLARSRALANGAWHGELARRLFRGRIERALVSSVAGPRARAALKSAAARAGVPVTFVRVPKKAGGVTVGYLEPWRLGVDRYVALVGAHRLFGDLPVLIAGIGTALTLDVLTRSGRHLGGAIIPSPSLMVETLLTRTKGIRRRARGGMRAAAGPFGRSTRAAITEGARYAAAAAIDRAVEEAAPLVGRRPLVILTGGGAAAVRPLLRSHCVTVPDLVLLGLAALAAERP